MVLGKLDSHMHKNKIGPMSYTTYKNQSKLIKDLNVRPETVELLEEIIGKNYNDLGNNFLIWHQKYKQQIQK